MDCFLKFAFLLKYVQEKIVSIFGYMYIVKDTNLQETSIMFNLKIFNEKENFKKNHSLIFLNGLLVSFKARARKQFSVFFGI